MSARTFEVDKWKVSVNVCLHVLGPVIYYQPVAQCQLLCYLLCHVMSYMCPVHMDSGIRQQKLTGKVLFFQKLFLDILCPLLKSQHLSADRK